MPDFKQKIAQFCINQRTAVLVFLSVFTGFFLFQAMQMDIKTVFKDLLPSEHPYIGTNEKYAEQFGGPNMVSIRVHVEDGDIFQFDVLKIIQDLQQELRTVTAVNEFQIVSLASKKLKRTSGSTYGIESVSLMWPDVPETAKGLDELRQGVLENLLVYGSYVSLDLKSALITVDFIDRLVDYDAIYRDINRIISEIDNDKVQVSAVGEPILRGLINGYLPQTTMIFFGSILVMCVILFLGFMRSLRGAFIPFVNAIVSGIWALGIGNLIGLALDPLGIVIAFLITARVISHSVQSITRFDEVVEARIEAGETKDLSKIAAEVTLGTLMRPGILSVITDAGGIMVVALAPIPLLQKTAILGAIWVSCIVVTGVILTPVLLTLVRDPSRYLIPFNLNEFYSFLLRKMGNMVIGPARWIILGIVILICTGGLYYASTITVGDAHHGTPLLWPESEYNQAVKKINDEFLGTDTMFVVVKGEEKNAITQPSVLNNMLQFQRHVELQSSIGGSVSIADLIPNINRILHEGNPRYEDIGKDALSNGELIYMYLAGSDPGDLNRFTDMDYQDAAITIYFRDHTGETIRTAISRIKHFIAQENDEGFEYLLAGGMIGLLAAVNEVIFVGQMESIAFALLVVLLTCTFTYRSSVAGLYFMIPVLITNILTFSYMSFNNIGLNINSLPVAAIGIGLGVNYSIYVVDAIKEYFEYKGDRLESVYYGLRSAGRGVLNSSIPLILCTTFWFFLSSLRFQAEMAILIAIWMALSAISALVVMPALIILFRPRFVFNNQIQATTSSM